jgi:hypothetical protein
MRRSATRGGRGTMMIRGLKPTATFMRSRRDPGQGADPLWPFAPQGRNRRRLRHPEVGGNRMSPVGLGVVRELAPNAPRLCLPLRACPSQPEGRSRVPLDTSGLQAMRLKRLVGRLCQTPSLRATGDPRAPATPGSSENPSCSPANVSRMNAARHGSSRASGSLPPLPPV